MFHSFLVGCKEGHVEDWVDLPSRGNAEMEGSSLNDFFDFERTSSLHLELLGSSHMKVGFFQPYLILNLPWSELGHDLLLHFLLGHLVGSLGIITSRGKV